MFTEDGIWKEFGIGRSPSTHTWLPFWLFAIVWAILSYIIILMIARVLPGVEIPETSAVPAQPQTPSISYKNFEPMPKTRGKRANSLIPGYYILNREATELAGAPKYIYLGAEAPGLENQGPGLEN